MADALLLAHFAIHCLPSAAHELILEGISRRNRQSRGLDVGGIAPRLVRDDALDGSPTTGIITLD